MDPKYKWERGNVHSLEVQNLARFLCVWNAKCFFGCTYVENETRTTQKHKNHLFCAQKMTFDRLFSCGLVPSTTQAGSSFKDDQKCSVRNAIKCNFASHNFVLNFYETFIKKHWRRSLAKNKKPCGAAQN